MTSDDQPITLVALTRRRWLLPVLAAMQRGTPVRLPVLASELGASRGGITEALDALVDLGLLAATPPPRHPLQSELMLTTAGARIASMAGALAHAADDLVAAPLLRNRWALPVIAHLRTPMRYGALRRALPLATDRALALSLSSLVDAALVARAVLPAMRPPATSYELMSRARPLAAILHNSPLGNNAHPR